MAVASCGGEPIGVPQLAQRSAERYLEAWQKADWNTIYKLQGSPPDSGGPVLHKSLTDRLEFYTISEVRYTDSAAACAVSLRWMTPAGAYNETGELYLERDGLDWRITRFRRF